MPLKVGLIGAGHLGKIHIQQWLTIPEATFVGFYDSDYTNAASVSEQYGVKAYPDITSLINEVDAVDIVTPTIYHFDIAKQVLQSGKHLFIEKPMTEDLAEASEMIRLVQEANVKCQIGHVERYNPALLTVRDQLFQPMFIESHRLSQFNPRGTDVSVILDLMIHDIDIVLHLVKSTIKRISASGVSVISHKPDIANARIEFDNGCVANLTSSRISLKKMRKMRLFQRDAYIGIDFLDKKSEVIKLKEDNDFQTGIAFPIDLGNGQHKMLGIDMPIVEPTNAIRQELFDFADAINNNKPVTVSVHDGYQALEVAHQILAKMEVNRASYNENK